MTGPCYIALDLETSGLDPQLHAILAIGACLVDNPAESFYTTVKPPPSSAINDRSMAVNGLDLDEIMRDGETPRRAIVGLCDWVTFVAHGCLPILVCHNAAFDWSFLTAYLTHYAKNRRPWHYAPIDTKAMAFALLGMDWLDTATTRLPVEFRPAFDHHALHDARACAALFTALLGHRAALSEAA